MCAHACTHVHRDQKIVLDSLELQLQCAVTTMWVLQPCSSARETNAHNSQAVSPVQFILNDIVPILSLVIKSLYLNNY